MQSRFESSRLYPQGENWIQRVNELELRTLNANLKSLVHSVGTRLPFDFRLSNFTEISVVCFLKGLLFHLINEFIILKWQMKLLKILFRYEKELLLHLDTKTLLPLVGKYKHKNINIVAHQNIQHLWKTLLHNR